MHIGGSSDTVNNPNLLSNGCESVKVIIYRPKMQDVDADYNHLYGKPLGEVRTLSELSGYTEIGEVHIDGEDFASATETEMAMLQEALLNGVIL